MECKKLCNPKHLSKLGCPAPELPLCTIDGQQYTPYAECDGGWVLESMRFEKGYETKTCADVRPRQGSA